MNVKVDLSRLGIEEAKLASYQKKVDDAMDELWSDKNPHTQWVKLPMRINEEEIESMLTTAIAAQESCGLFVVIGNGGSYLGIKAAIEAIGEHAATAPEIEFIGEDICGSEFSKIIERMRHYEVNVCVISKSGETPETIVVYQVIKEYMFKRYGNEVAPKRIMVMTGKGDSTLRKLANKDGCGIFDISTDYSGNYGILSPASLFPMAVAGIEIDRLLSGAEVMATDAAWDINAGYYGVARKILNESGKVAEIFQYSQPNLESFAMWVSHLFMESDSKNGKGIYTTTMNLSRDFKAKGEFMRGDTPAFFQTELVIDEVQDDILLPKDIIDKTESDTLGELNQVIVDKMKEAMKTEDSDAIKIEIPKMDAFNLGQLIYFFLMSASISAHMFGVDPFERKLIDVFKDKIKLFNK